MFFNRCLLSQSQEEFEIFCTKFDIILSQINDEFPLCSAVTWDFNAGCTNWWKGNITNSTGQEIATQIIDKPAHVINNSMSCVDLSLLSFLTNVITITSMARQTSVYHSHQNISVKYGIAVKQMFKILRNLLKNLIAEKILNPFL